MIGKLITEGLLLGALLAAFCADADDTWRDALWT